MVIYKRVHAFNRLIYHVTCPECKHQFEQAGCPYDILRDLEQRKTLSAKQISALRFKMIQDLCEKDDFSIEETHYTIRMGYLVFTKHKPLFETE